MMDKKLWDNEIYTPRLDDQAIIDKLEIMIIHQLRWGSFYSLLQSHPFDLVAEALICNMAFGGIIRPYDLGQPELDQFWAQMYIYFLGWKLLPYASYRHNHVLKGTWPKSFWNWPDNFSNRYPIVCDLLIKRSEAELLRD